MIQITDQIVLSERDIRFEAVTASGPGGQNVNRVKTAVQLRYPVFSSSDLPEPVKERLLQQAGGLINRQGELVIEAQRFRTQQRNRVDALERLVRIVQRAAVRPKRRKKTRPGKKSVERRLQEKHRHSEKKRRRGSLDGR